MDGDLFFFQDPKDTYVREAFGGAAPENKGHLRIRFPDYHRHALAGADKKKDDKAQD